MLPFQGANGILFIDAGRCPALGYSAPSGRFIRKVIGLKCAVRHKMLVEN